MRSAHQNQLGADTPIFPGYPDKSAGLEYGPDIRIIRQSGQSGRILSYRISGKSEISGISGETAVSRMCVLFVYVYCVQLICGRSVRHL